MRCENKPLLQDDAGFLQKITPIAVEVGLVPKKQALYRAGASCGHLSHDSNQNSGSSKRIAVFDSDNVVKPIGGCERGPVTDVQRVAATERRTCSDLEIEDICAAGG